MKLQVKTRIAMLSAIAFVLMFVGEVPIPWIPGAKFDLSEVPAIFAALTLGPVAGIAVEVVKGLLFLVSGKSEAGIIGMAANMLAGATMVGVTALVGRAFKLSADRTRTYMIATGLFAALAGGAAAAVVMFVVNAWIMIPLYFSQPAPQWAASAAWIPLNLIKGTVSGGLGVLVYAAVAPYVGSLGRKAA